jgi:ABC-type cobalamin/Fe3+-siderophores transport system ATPase subunit
MASIHLQNVHLRQAERLILDIESNEIPVSNITGIIGPNGAGKTILLKLIAGLIQNPKFQISCSFKDISMVLSQTPLLKMSVQTIQPVQHGAYFIKTKMSMMPILS